MFQYIVKRLLLLVFTLFGIAAITFALTRLTPGDPAAMRVRGSSGGGSQAVGGYDDLVELNRRNLGLDKPLILNLDFEDRDLIARRALDDFLRSEPFWRNDGERRLARVSTIALPAVLERFPLIGTENEPIPLTRDGRPRQMASPEEQKLRLAALLPRLAAETTLDAPASPPDAVHAFWADWYQEHRERFEEDRVSRLVDEYMTATAAEDVDRLATEIYKAGGYAVPHLAQRLGTSDLQSQERLSRVLQAQTGFTFVSDEGDFAASADDAMRRWRSWWLRESVAFSDYTPWRDALNSITNTQFGLWISQVIRFDFGDSYVKRRPVISLMASALPVTLMLSGLSILFSHLIAIPIGIFSAVRRHSRSDKVVTLILVILYSLPSFWVAGILLMTMTGPPFLDLFPTRGLNTPGVSLDSGFLQWFLDRLWHLVLPVLCLTYASLAFLSRQMRSAMLETINQDYIRTAMAKGLPGHVVIFKHALRNSLIPILTISAGLLPELIAGAVIIESIFTIPGMGTLMFEAIVNRDYPIINAVLFLSAFLTLLGILLADLSYALVDPRIKYS